MFLWLCRIFFTLPVSIFHPTSIRGKKNIPSGKAILCSNHLSNWDMVLYYLNTTKKVAILAKKELFKNRILAWCMKALGAFPVDRESNDINAIKNCMKILKDEKKLFIFPEGTRLKDEDKELGEFKGGLALIAIKTKTPIVPIWIKSKPKIFRKSVYTIGKPFELEEFYGQKLDEETLERANQVVRQKMLELKEESSQKKDKNNKK